MEDYKKLLEEARKSLPEHVFQKERFEIPKVMGHIQGNRTIINNFLQIANTLGRRPEDMLKFVLRELATPGEIKKSGSVIVGSKVPASRINEKIKLYSDSYVFCYECGKPDTKIEKEGNFSFLKCTACGARHVIKSKVKL
jgi:translation initiation factor 2 subunit 2